VKGWGSEGLEGTGQGLGVGRASSESRHWAIGLGSAEIFNSH